MRNKRVFPIIIYVIMVLVFSFASVSAQNVDNMSNEELTTLLLQIMQKLEQTEEPAETPEPTPTPTPEPTKEPLPELSDDKAELEALLMAIMQKLDQKEETEAAPEKPAGTMVPVSEAGEKEENSIWDNKKLIIEGLPEYMFIQPTEAPKPEKPAPNGGNPGGGNSGGGNPPSRSCDGRPGVCSDGTREQCVCDIYGNCYWTCAKG